MSNNERRSWWQKVLAFFFEEPEQEPAPIKSQPKSQASEPYVFITKSGKRFHYSADCPALQSAWSENKVLKTDLSKARKSGRTACNKCCWNYLHE